MSKSLFPMSYRRAHQFFNDYAKSMSDIVGVSISLDDEIGIGFGYTDDEAPIGDGSIIVRIREIVESDSIFKSFEHIPVDMFVQVYVSVNHEMRHSEIYADMKSQENEVSNEILSAHIAKQGFSKYYMNNRLWYVTEIDAERKGVANTYKDLCFYMKSEKDALNAICNYINHQCEQSTYYFEQREGKRFTTLDEINNAFAEAYDLAMSKESVVRDGHGLPDKSKRYREIRLSWKKDEAIAQCLDEQGRLKPGFQSVFNMMWDSSNADKDRMMASLTLNAMPELKQFYGEQVADELRPEKVFGDVWSLSVQRTSDKRERVDISLVNDVGDELDRQLE